MKKGEERLAQFLVAGRKPAELLHLIEEPLHFLTSLLWLSVIDNGLLTIPLGRDDGRHLLVLEALADRLAILALVHDHIRQRGQGRALLQDGLKDRRIMAGATGQFNGDTGLFVKTAGVPCGGEPTPRASQSLCRLPAGFFRAPAAC
jgi:hypothetical protein